MRLGVELLTPLVAAWGRPRRVFHVAVMVLQPGGYRGQLGHGPQPFAAHRDGSSTRDAEPDGVPVPDQVVRRPLVVPGPRPLG